MKRSDDDIDTLLRDWDRVASTARPPAADARRTVRSTAALPMSLVLVGAVAIVVVAILGRGGTGPATPGSADPGSEAPSPTASAAAAVDGFPGPVTGINEDGRFRIILTADRSTYAEGDAITALATVEFLGPEATTEVEHASSPVVFSVLEIGGKRHVDGGVRTLRTSTPFGRGEVVRYPWSKSGGTGDDPVNDAFVEQYLEGANGELRLPAGTWELTAVFATGLSASVRVTVMPATAADPGAAPVEARDADTRFSLRLRADRSTYREGEAIDAAAVVEYLGPEAFVEVRYTEGPVVFSVLEVGGDRTTGVILSRLVCHGTSYERGSPRTHPWVKAGAYSNDNPTPNDAFIKAYLDIGPDGRSSDVLRLPAGTWTLTARLGIAVGPNSPPDMCGGEPHDLTTSVTIRVLPGVATAATPPAPTEVPHAVSHAPATPAATPGPAGPLDLGPMVRCGRINPADCEGAIALVRQRVPDGYEEAVLIVVDDTCRPDVLCDRQYAFDAVVVLVSEGGAWGNGSASAVRGQRGPEEVAIGEGYVTWWILDLVKQGLDAGNGAVRIPTGLPRWIGGPGATAQACPAALLEGRLVADPVLGLAVMISDGTVVPTLWPFGYEGRIGPEGVALVDLAGTVVARSGEVVRLGGSMAGFDPPGMWVTCGGV